MTELGPITRAENAEAEVIRLRGALQALHDLAIHMAVAITQVVGELEE